MLSHFEAPNIPSHELTIPGSGPDEAWEAGFQKQNDFTVSIFSAIWPLCISGTVTNSKWSPEFLFLGYI